MIVGVPCALLSLLQAQPVVGADLSCPRADLSRPLRARAVERRSRHTPVIFTTEGTGLFVRPALLSTARWVGL